MSGLLPRDQEISSRRDKIKLVNQKLREWCRSGKVRNAHYLKPDKDWTEPDGRLGERYYFTDFLHLVEEGYANPDQQHHHPKHNRNSMDKQHQRHLQQQY